MNLIILALLPRLSGKKLRRVLASIRQRTTGRLISGGPSSLLRVSFMSRELCFQPGERCRSSPTPHKCTEATCYILTSLCVCICVHTPSTHASILPSFIRCFPLEGSLKISLLFMNVCLPTGEAFQLCRNLPVFEDTWRFTRPKRVSMTFNPLGVISVNTITFINTSCENS